MISQTARGDWKQALLDDDGRLIMVGLQPSNSVFTLPYDFISAAYPSSTQEVYTTRNGGESGAIQEIITVTYVDSTKVDLLTIQRQ